MLVNNDPVPTKIPITILGNSKIFLFFEERATKKISGIRGGGGEVPVKCSQQGAMTPIFRPYIYHSYFALTSWIAKGVHVHNKQHTLCLEEFHYFLL